MTNKDTPNIYDELSIDEVIINLKIIGHIKKNQKLSISEKLLDVDKYPFFQPLFRWINNDNRFDTVNFLTHLLNESDKYVEELIQDIKNYKKDINDLTKIHSEKLLISIRNELINAQQGLINIKNTYNENAKTKYTLERLAEKFGLLIDKTKLFLDNIEKKRKKKTV